MLSTTDRAATEAGQPSRSPPAGLTASQWEAICALTPLDATRVPTTEDARSSGIYISDARFEAEKTALFGTVPVVVAASAYLPEPGMSFAQDGYGLPLLVTRNREGRARVFINACQHRGSKLVECREAQRSARVSCPYHAWTYSLDGQLVGVPRAETFPSLDKDALGLVPLDSFEAGGFIWAMLDRKAAAAPLPGTELLCADLEAFGLHRMHAYGRRSYDLPANWKLLIEPFLEPYHIQRLHANSIAKIYADVPNVVTHLGHHQRQVSGKAHFDPSLLHGEISNLHKHLTHAYLVFPNTIVVTSPYYISLMTMMPRTRARTVVDYYMLVKSAPDNPKAEDLYRRSYDLVDKVFGGEDFRAACLQQEGLASGAVETVRFGGLEEMIGPFHRSIETFVDAASS